MARELQPQETDMLEQTLQIPAHQQNPQTPSTNSSTSTSGFRQNSNAAKPSNLRPIKRKHASSPARLVSASNRCSASTPHRPPHTHQEERGRRSDPSRSSFAILSTQTTSHQQRGQNPLGSKTTLTKDATSKNSAHRSNRPPALG